MKKLCVFLFVITSINARAADYYFSSSSGNDNNAGTATDAPFQSIAKLNSIFYSLIGGDHIYFKKGDVFYGEIKVSSNGAPENPIVLGAYGNGPAPVITGFKNIKSWVNLGKNIWESTNAVSTEPACKLVLINGINEPMGRFPNDGYLTIQSHTQSSVTTNALPGNIDWSNSTLVVRKNRYTLSDALISSTSYSGNNCTINYSGKSGYNNGSGFFIENSSATLDKQGEWYYNTDSKKLRVYSNVSPVNAQVSTLGKLLDCTNHSNISVENLDFKGADSAFIYSYYKSDNISIRNCNFIYSGSDGIYFPNSANHLIIENNTVKDCNQSAIFSGDTKANGTIIRNNSIEQICMNTGQIKNSGSAINCYPAGSLVQYNTIDSCGYNGIYFRGNNTRIMNNLIQNFCLLLDDGAGIYTSYNDNNRKIISNIIINGIGNGDGTSKPDDRFVQGIYLDDSCSNVQVINNSINNVGSAGIFLHSAHDNLIQGNKIYNAKGLGYTQGAIALQKDGATFQPMRNDTIWNNILVAANANQLCFYYSSNTLSDDDYRNFGISDSNYFASPKSAGIIKLLHNTPPYATIQHSFASWKNYSAMESHSADIIKVIKNPKDILFEYNATQAEVSIDIPGTYTNMKGVVFNQSVILRPYNSEILFKK